MTCYSPIHPDGCPTAHLSAGSCHCDCHADCAPCIVCDLEHDRADMEQTQSGPVCADCRPDVGNCDWCDDRVLTDELELQGFREGPMHLCPQCVLNRKGNR